MYRAFALRAASLLALASLTASPLAGCSGASSALPTPPVSAPSAARALGSQTEPGTEIQDAHHKKKKMTLLYVSDNEGNQIRVYDASSKTQNPPPVLRTITTSARRSRRMVTCSFRCRSARGLALRSGGKRFGSNKKTVMKRARRIFSVLAAAGELAACTHSNYMPNVIQLTPKGTAAQPADQSIARSFTLFAVEDGYTGEFTAQTVVGMCWVVQAPVTTGGAWTVVPQGSTCSRLDTEKIQVQDTNGHSAVTYIRSVQ
jgi:hypothetical protein